MDDIHPHVLVPILGGWQRSRYGLNVSVTPHIELYIYIYPCKSSITLLCLPSTSNRIFWPFSTLDTAYIRHTCSPSTTMSDYTKYFTDTHSVSPQIRVNHLQQLREYSNKSKCQRPQHSLCPLCTSFRPDHGLDGSEATRPSAGGRGELIGVVGHPPVVLIHVEPLFAAEIHFGVRRESLNGAE